MADTKLAALEWQRDLQDFYLTCSRRVLHRHLSSYPPRNETPCRVFTCGRDYFGAVVVALLSAQHEILIASWMVSPYLWLTRPPEPPLRLDQVLKFKAEQGVKIYVMLYQEVRLFVISLLIYYSITII
jgi:phosphatidylserine/phosphatidylglycerophosphate/cardiolipin synthase-like enzyme